MNQSMQKRLITVLICVSVLMVIVTAVLLIVTQRETVPPPFVPPEFDASAQQGVPTVPQELGWSEINSEKLPFKVAVCGVIRIQDGKAKIYLTNYEENTLWMKVRILSADGTTILGETGLIKPGEYVAEVPFDRLPQNGDSIKLRLMSYEPETYYSGGAVSLNTVAIVEGE